MLGTRPADILYVDNDLEACEGMRTLFRESEKGCNLTCSMSPVQTQEMISQRSFDMYILEYCLTEITGSELCRKIRIKDRDTPIVIYSALFREIDRETALGSGANAFIVKSDGFSNLSATIRRLLILRPVISRHHHPARRSTQIF